MWTARWPNLRVGDGAVAFPEEDEEDEAAAAAEKKSMAHDEVSASRDLPLCASPASFFLAGFNPLRFRWVLLILFVPLLSGCRSSAVWWRACPTRTRIF